jgi:hypothetical protein
VLDRYFSSLRHEGFSPHRLFLQRLFFKHVVVQ